MDKYFHFKTKGLLDYENFESIISGMYHEKFEIKYYDYYSSGYIKADASFYDSLANIVQIMQLDLNCNMTFLVSFEKSSLSKLALTEAEKYFPNRITTLSTLYLATLINHEEYFTTALDKMFDSITYEQVQTAMTFIQCGMNGVLASKRLYVHRNTFNYRLNAFVEKTKLDIRDYDNAMLFDLYTKQKYLK